MDLRFESSIKLPYPGADWFSRKSDSNSLDPDN